MGPKLMGARNQAIDLSETKKSWVRHCKYWSVHETVDAQSQATPRGTLNFAASQEVCSANAEVNA